MEWVTYTSDERRDERDASLSASDSLAETEKKSQVTVDVVLLLEFTSGLDTLPCRSDLDEDTLLLDADRLVQGNELLGLGLGALLVEGQTSVDLGGDTAGDESENFLAKLDKLGRG